MFVVAIMRTITVGLLLALLGVVCQVNGASIPGFKKEKVYVYDYEGRVATGISEDDVKYFSGFGVKSHLTVYNKDDKVYFKFDDTKVGRVNTKVEDFFVPLHIDYAVSDDPIVKKTVEEIEKPFVAIYDDGVFKAYYDPDDSMSNWRKAVVGIFQTQFHPTEAHEPNFYKTYEEGVGGKCKTLYKIAHIPSEYTDSEVEVMNVTKVRFYDKCKHRPHLFHSSIEGYKCSHCKQEKINALKTFGRVQYQIRGNKQQFTIEKVYASGAITFTPFTTHGQTVLSVVNQTMDLASESESATPFEVDTKDYKEYDSLSFKFYPDTVKDVHEIKNHHYNRVYKKPDPENPVEELLPKLSTLAKDYKESGKESQTVMKVIYHLQKFEYEHFVELFDNQVHGDDAETKEKKTVKFVLYEVLPYVGTNAAVKYMLELIEKHKVDKPTANEMVYKFPFYIKEFCPLTMEMMENFLKKEEVRNYLSTWHTGILAYGNLINKACTVDDMHPHHEYIRFHEHPEVCSKYIKELKDKFESVVSKNPKDASIYLRALINTEHPEAYKVIVQVVKDAKYPGLLRRTAIWGLDHFYEDHVEEVVAILAPIYFDMRNDYVLRTYAFGMLLYTHPSSEFFSNLILSLETEPNEKVASFIFSTLATVANTTDPCHQYIGEKAKYVLQFVKPKQDYDIVRHSSNRIFSAYNAKYNFGRTSQFSVIPSEHSVVPRELYMRQSFNLLGYNFDFLEVGFSTDEDSVLSHLGDYFGPAGIKKDYDHEHSDSVKDIVSKLHLDKSRDHDEDARYEIYVKMFGYDMKVTQKYDFDDSNEVTFDKDKLTYDMHSVTYTEVEYIVPNEMGFPVVLTLNVPVTFHVAGSAKIQPRQSEGYAGNVDVSAHVGAEFTVKAKMFVYTPTFRKYGYELKTSGGFQFPIKGSVDVDTHTKKFAVKYVPSSEAYEMLHYDTTPMAIFPEEPYYYPIKYSEHPVHKEYKVGHDYFGVGLKYSFDYDYQWNDYGSYRDFFKSFFHKYTRYEDYFYLLDKYYAGTRGFLDYAVVNPTAKPFHFHVKFEPSETHPTKEFTLTNKYNHTRYFEQDKGHDTCKTSLSVVGRGPVERRWDVLFSVSKTYPEEDFRKVVFHYERSPIPNYDEKKFELHYKSNVTYVNYMTIFTEKPEDVSVKYNGKLTIGTEEDSQPKEIYVKMLAEQTEEHKNADKTKVSFYKKCKEDMEKKAFFTDACWKVMKDAGRIDKLTFDFEFKNIPKEYKGFAYRVYSWFRHTFYNNLYIDYFHGSNEENHINVVANFSYHYPVFDLKITKPDHTVYYNKVYAPSVFPKYEPFNIAEDGKERFMRKFFSYQQPRCFVTGNRVHTFDGLDYPFDKEASRDYHLVAGDCNSHQFFAFVKKVVNPKLDKAVKFYFHDDVFEVVPKADGEELELYVNKEKKEGTHGFIYPITNHPSYKLSVSYWGKGVYIESKDYGVHLYTDGKNTCFMVNNYYRGKQCGLCGDLDGETHHEYKKPDGTPITYTEMNQYYRYHEE